MTVTLSDLPPDVLVAVACRLRCRGDQHALYCAFRAARDALSRAVAADDAAAVVIDMADAIRTGDDRTVAQRLATGVPAPLRFLPPRTIRINGADLSDLPPLWKKHRCPESVRLVRISDARIAVGASFTGALYRLASNAKAVGIKELEVEAAVVHNDAIDIADAINAAAGITRCEGLALRVSCWSAKWGAKAARGSIPPTLVRLSVECRQVYGPDWASHLLNAVSASVGGLPALRVLSVRQPVCESVSLVSPISLRELGRHAPALTSVLLDVPKHSIAGIDALLPQLEILSLACRALVPDDPQPSSPQRGRIIGLRVLHLNVGNAGMTGRGMFEAFRADALEELCIEWPNVVSAAAASGGLFHPCFLSSTASLARLRIDGIPGHVRPRQVLSRATAAIDPQRHAHETLRSFSAPGMVAFDFDFAAIAELLPPSVRELELMAVPSACLRGVPPLPQSLETLVIADGCNMPSPLSWASLGELLERGEGRRRIRLVLRESKTSPQASLRCKSKEELEAMGAAALVLASARVRSLRLVGDGNMLAPHVLARLCPLGETVEEVRIDGDAVVCARGLEALRTVFPLMNAL